MDPTEALRQRIAELEAENRKLRSGFFQPSGDRTVIVPPALAPLFDAASATVHSFFENAHCDPARGHILIGDQRYVLVRASALSIDFLETIQQLYADRGEAEARQIGLSFLFDIAHSLGISDARNFHRRMSLTDPIARLSAGPVHFAYTGWAMVDIKPESHPVADDDYLLLFDHPYSFEAASWIAAGRRATHPVCIMSAGYSSGWCEESFGLPLTAVEVSCRARGDEACRFIMAPPHRIAAHLEERLGAEMHRTAPSGLHIPTYFDRKHAEEALRRSEEHLRQVIESMPVLMQAFDKEGRILAWNRECERVTGFTAEEILGDPQAFARIYRDEETRTAIRQECREGGGEHRHLERSLTCKDGSRRVIAWSSISRTFPLPGWATWGVGLDITQQKKLQASLAQADRMASVGLLAAGVAHEINNPLTFIYLSMESLKAELPPILATISRYRSAVSLAMDEQPVLASLGSAHRLLDPGKLQELMDLVREGLVGLQRVRDIVKDLKTFSRVETDVLEAVVLNEPLESALTMARNEIKYRARLVREYSNIPAVQANSGRLSQVFLNLILNAAHAIPEGDVAHHLIRVRTLLDGDTVVVEIEDSGCGIAPEHQKRLFEPFFTTKPAGVGSGLGLSICYSIVTTYGGRIEVVSTPGHGSRFSVRLPKLSGETGQGAILLDEPHADPSPDGRRILVVDDEPAIAELLGHLLSRFGEVVVCTSGARALATLELDRRFDLIICDLIMPEVTGVDLYEWAAARQPELTGRFLLITGGAFTAGANEFLARGEIPRLEKPFSREDLFATVQTILRARPRS